MTMPSPNDPNAKPLSPDGLANQLFDAALMQNPTNPRVVAQQVIDFLASSLFYAITSSKNDVIVYLTEAIIYVASASSADEPTRKELLKKIGDTIADAPPLKPAGPAQR